MQKLDINQAALQTAVKATADTATATVSQHLTIPYHDVYVHIHVYTYALDQRFNL